MEITKEQSALLEKHLDLVLFKNQQLNLTAIKDKDEAMVLHLEDSLAGLEELNSIEGEFVDMGSGAGFPGIPLSIVSGKKATLVETVGKKADCLKSFINELNLEAQVSVSNKRIEELAVERPNSYAAATARALSSVSSLLELAAPLLVIKGLLICYKGNNVEEELNAAFNITEKLGFKFVSNRKYVLSDNTEHRIVVFKKVKEAEVKLPRKLGFAQKKPFTN